MAPRRRTSEEFAKEIAKVLENPPKFEGLSAQDVAKQMNEPVSTTRIRLEMLRASGVVTEVRVGKTKLYNLLKHKR